MDISDRRRMVLSAIITLHAKSGEPIGSKTLLDRFNISSATIRNEMAALTEMGLLEQPYTSAGRVPTVSGYRYYVRNLMSLYPLSAEEQARIRGAVYALDTDPDKAAQQAARAIAEITGLAAVSTTVHGTTANIIHYELIRVGKYNVAVLGVSNAGSVKSRVCRTERVMNDGELAGVTEALNKNAVFVSREDVGRRVRDAIDAALGGIADTARPVVEAALLLISEVADVEVYTTGLQNLLRFRELSGCMMDLLEVFSDDEFLKSCFERVTEPVAVYVGDETRLSGVTDVSMVLSRFRASGGMYGGIGVAGPVRMNYEYIIPRVKFFCDSLSSMLTSV